MNAKIVCLSVDLRKLPKKDKATGRELPGEFHHFQELVLMKGPYNAVPFQHYVNDPSRPVAVGEYEVTGEHVEIDRNGRLAVRPDFSVRIPAALAVRPVKSA